MPQPVWMAARARNAMHRPVFIGALSVGTFITALVAMVVMPQQAQRAAKALAPKPGERPDTAPLVAIVTAAHQQLATADSAVAAARARSAYIAQAAIDTMNPVLRARRDSLQAGLAGLATAIDRTEAAPLPASYRALAETPPLAGNPRVHALLDSLSEIERAREGFGATGGADPVFVSLTSRATDIGRGIEAIAVQRRDSMRNALAVLTRPPRFSPAQLAQADTAARIAARDSVRTQVEAAEATLAGARRRLDELDRRAEKAREIATFNAPPMALLGAAIIFGLVLGFGTAFSSELRRPRIANELEAERVSGVRVLSTVRQQQPSPERMRRHADRIAPPYIDPGADGHQLAYLHLAAETRSGLMMLTITGEDAAVAAVIAANFAANAADEARNVLVVDTDVRASPVAAALRLRADPGLVEIIDGQLSWPEATVQTTVGRDRVISVVPSGTGTPVPEPKEIAELLRRDAARLARYYDTILIVATAEQTLDGLPGVLPSRDVLYCARVGHTKLRDLRTAMASIRGVGGRPVGLVLWDAEPPVLATPKELAARHGRPRTGEMAAVPSTA